MSGGSAFNEDIQEYIRNIAYNVIDISAWLDVSSLAIAGAIAGEYFELFEKSYAEQVIEFGVGEAAKTWSHDEILEDYENYHEYHRGDVHAWYVKTTHPTTNDIGYGSINLGTAIDMLKYYQQSEFATDDPLNLEKYFDDYALLTQDLVDPKSGATEKLPG